MRRTRPRTRSRLTAALAVSACLLAAACGDDPTLSGSSATSSSDTVEAPESQASPDAPAGSAAPTAAGDDGGTGDASTEPSIEPSTEEPVGGPLTVTEARVARQDGFDRVVLELDGAQPGEPGWRVSYEDDPRRAGSGDPVELDGEAVLVVLVDGAGYPFDTGVEEVSSVTVPDDLEVVQEVDLGAVYEGTYEAFIGVSRKAPFTVTRLADPARVVIDISHG